MEGGRVQCRDTPLRKLHLPWVHREAPVGWATGTEAQPCETTRSLWTGSAGMTYSQTGTGH